MDVWLNVAEKPSVAKEIANVLSNRSQRASRSFSQYNPVFEFGFTPNGARPVSMIVTSVAGHLLGTDFGSEHKSWSSSIINLFDAPIHKTTSEDKKGIKKNLEELAKRSSHLVLWLDCDREGENICFEVMSVVQSTNSRIRIARAHFSALTARDLLRAVNNLGVPNKALSDAVEARQEMDLRIGASFTRFQTTRLRDQFPNLPNVVSFGPCQIPTLGFVVKNHWRREGFIAEETYKASLSAQGTTFSWARGHIYDMCAASIIFEEMIEASAPREEAVVEAVENKPQRRHPPFPLATVAMQKLASSNLSFSSEQTMQLAEKLYQEGYISYPRTETDSFSLTTEELLELAKNLGTSQNYGAYVNRLVSGEVFQAPRDGGHNDKAHPPIHPTKLFDGPPSDPKTRLFDLIARAFLACLSKDAIAASTSVTIQFGRERFFASGQTVLERNWLDIFPFERWSSTRIPNFSVDQVFSVDEVLLHQGTTQPPQKLSETQLISLMDQQGIGTDATIAQHIKTIQERQYVTAQAGRFVPTPLGIALLAAYEELGFAELAEPRLRAQMELAMGEIASGAATKDAVVMAASAKYRSILENLMRKERELISCLAKFLSDQHSHRRT